MKRCEEAALRTAVKREYYNNGGIQYLEEWNKRMHEKGYHVNVEEVKKEFGKCFN